MWNVVCTFPGIACRNRTKGSYNMWTKYKNINIWFVSLILDGSSLEIP